MTMMLARPPRRIRPARSTVITERTCTRSSIPSTHMTLAAMIDRFDHHAVALGKRTFLPNDAITWVALRGMRGPIQRQNPYTEKLAACFARATLAYGIPSLLFSWNSASVLHPSRMKYLNRYFTHQYQPPFNPQQLREWRVLLKMQAQWRFARTMGPVETIGTLPTGERGHARIDLTAASQCLPQPFLAYAWKDVAALKRSSCRSSRWIINTAVIPMTPVALVAADSIAPLHERLKPFGLWWDVTGLGHFLHCDLESFIFT